MKIVSELFPNKLLCGSAYIQYIGLTCLGKWIRKAKKNAAVSKFIFKRLDRKM